MSRTAATLGLLRPNDAARAGADAPLAALAVRCAINVSVAMAENGDDANNLARTSRSALATGNALFQVESDEGSAVMPRKRQVKPTSRPAFYE